MSGYANRSLKIETDLAVIEWLLGFVTAGAVSLIIKTFVQAV